MEIDPQQTEPQRHRGGNSGGVLRTPEYRFKGLPGYPFEAHYVRVGGLRMHYVDEGEGSPIVCLHGEPTWSYLYREMIPEWADVGRVIAPDLIGFGKSDKPLDPAAHTFYQHLNSLRSFIDQLRLMEITLVVHDWGGFLGLPLAVENPDHFARLVILNTGLPGPGAFSPLHPFRFWQRFARLVPHVPVGLVMQIGTSSWLSPKIIAGYRAPFPDHRYQLGVDLFPKIVPLSKEMPGVEAFQRARIRLRSWDKPTLVLFSSCDPFYARFEDRFRNLIPSAGNQPRVRVGGAGHFLQEDKGEEVAGEIVHFIKKTK